MAAITLPEWSKTGAPTHRQIGTRRMVVVLTTALAYGIKFASDETSTSIDHLVRRMYANNLYQ